MTERTEAEKQAIFDGYMEASQAFDEAVNGDIRKAGNKRDYEALFIRLREDLTSDVRSAMQVAYAKETLNAFEEGLRNAQ